MRILWITHDPIRQTVENSKSTSGFWKEALISLLTTTNDFIIGVAFPENKRIKILDTNYSFRYPFKKKDGNLSKNTIKDLMWIINDFKPELIHIHGTEKPYGLLRKYTNIPIVVSLQGFISECFNAVLGEIPITQWTTEKTLKERILRNSFIDIHNNWFTNSKYEQEIVRINKYFIGRTSFDKKFISKYNSNHTYFLGNEMLRDEFYQNKWDVNNIEKNSIFISSFKNPLKGFHVLLKSLPYLLSDYPGIKVYVPGNIKPISTNRFTGNSYYRMIFKLIDKYDLSRRIIFLGDLNAEEITKYLLKSHVFVLPSFVENSSNALGEAQILGLPTIVSSCCGGTADIIVNNRNGLFFDKGDDFDLSEKIRKIFSDDNLALKLSENSMVYGNDFHSREKIKNQYVTIYNSILNYESSTI